MRPVIYAISSAAIISMVACVTSNAAPIAPIPTATVGNLVQVGSYHRHRGYYAQARPHAPCYGPYCRHPVKNPPNPLRGTPYYGTYTY
jgi:hypothetical protein